MPRPTLLTTIAAALGVAALALTGTTAALAAPDAAPAAPNLKINEIETDGGPDWVELINLDAAPVDASGVTVTGRANAAAKAVPAGTVIPAGGVTLLEGDDVFKFKKNDRLELLAADGATLLDSFEWGDFHLSTWGRVPNGTGDIAAQSTKTPGALNPEGGTGGEGPADDAHTAITINEVTSENVAPYRDAFELFNSGDTDIDVADWLQADSGSAPAAIVPQAGSTVVPAGGFQVFLSNQGLSSDGDSVRLFLPDAVTLVDQATWGTNDAQPGSFSRCGDGSATWLHTESNSWGESNAEACSGRIIDLSGDSDVPCQTEPASDLAAEMPGGIAWPGSQEWRTADNLCQFASAVSGQDVSGLDIDPNEPGVMWAVKNKNHLYRLVQQGDLWVKDRAIGWADGKALVFPGQTDPLASQPDTEGITVGPDGLLYITTERDNVNKNVALDSVLRFDPNEAGPVLHPTAQWDVTADFAGVIDPAVKADANLGFEGITWVPDAFLTAQGYIDENTGAAYDPADYPNHGDGLFFLALEKNGNLYAYALGEDGATADRVGVVESGMPRIAEVQWDGDNGRLWAVADDSVGGSVTLLKAADGDFAVDRVFNRPTGLENLNLEGFALAPDSTCVDGQKQVVRSDDGNNGGHSLRAGTVDCDLALGGGSGGGAGGAADGGAADGGANGAGGAGDANGTGGAAGAADGGAAGAGAAGAGAAVAGATASPKALTSTGGSLGGLTALAAGALVLLLAGAALLDARRRTVSRSTR